MLESAWIPGNRAGGVPNRARCLFFGGIPAQSRRQSRVMTPGKQRIILPLTALVLVGSSSCNRPAPSKEVTPEASATQKKAGALEGGACRASGDCAQGLQCAEDKTCQTPKTIDCRGRKDVCEEEGRCRGKGGRCVPASADDCRKSQRCETDGRCSLQDDKCLAVSANDCSTLCQKFGRCTAQEGICVATSDAECKKSEVCTTAKRCRAAAGRCIGK